MNLEAVWFKNGKEIYRVDPVLDVVCYDNMTRVSNIEIYNGINWYSSEDTDTEEEADDFVIRIKKD